MIKYAYIDKGGTLHIVEKKKTAEEYSVNGKVVETEIPAERGFPTLKGEGIIVYSPEDMRFNSNGGKISPVKEFADLYMALKEI